MIIVTILLCRVTPETPHYCRLSCTFGRHALKEGWRGDRIDKLAREVIGLLIKSEGSETGLKLPLDTLLDVETEVNNGAKVQLAFYTVLGVYL